MLKRLIKKQKVTVIIPTLNEEISICNVIEIARRSKYTDEIIVVDDNSVDNTVKLAQECGAKVIISKLLGKGHSMYEGLQVAKNDIIVYLDGDINNYENNIVDILTKPIRNKKSDFVKSTFSREAGRVTELVAKPLLSLLFPELTKFSQPLSGMIAAKKEVLFNCGFENDYGVDIGLLIDVYKKGYKITEVNIGYIENKSKPWQQLGKMSKEVARAILKRAHTDNSINLDILETINIVQNEMEKSVNNSIIKLKKIAIFDMDNTILKGRYIYKVAEEIGKTKELLDIVTTIDDPFIRTKHIAILLKGLHQEYLLNLITKIPIIDDTKEVITKLKKRGYVVGILSDSYTLVTEYVKEKIGADFSYANQLIFKNNICTGEVVIPSSWLNTTDGPCKHNYCKTNVLNSISKNYKIPLSNFIAIGDSENDLCMIKNAGIGVSFCSNNNLLDVYADFIIKEHSFKSLLDIAQ